MNSQPRLPTLPHGSPTTLRGLSETFAFHSSPEVFITSRVLAFQDSNPSLAESRLPIRAKVLNRNVAVISSYNHIKQVLCDGDKAFKLSASKAYDELMAPFFPAPNLLLADPPAHEPMKNAWRARMAPLLNEVQSLVQKTVLAYFAGFTSGSTIDLYESMKELSWRLILGIFLPAGNAAEIEALQEDLLRGQFSLFPVSINARVWRSPRSKGLAARKRLQSLLGARVKNAMSGCPFATTSDADKDDVASHLLLFTSSLAVKSLASLLTAVLLNLFVYSEAGISSGDSLTSKIFSLESSTDRTELLRSIILETERLSPPVVGIMRRTTEDITLTSDQKHIPDTLIPSGWDVWMYFVGAARDPTIFGETADLFRPDRYYRMSDETDGPRKGLAFGSGPKACLGEDLMREIVMTVAKTCLGIDITSSGSEAKISMKADLDDIPTGVRGWLGWQRSVSPKEWAKDMKQLPTQRPIKPVIIKLIHELSGNV